MATLAAAAAATPWWATPSGVVVGALIGLAAGVYTARRKRLDEAATNDASRARLLKDEQRNAAAAFIGAAHHFRAAVPREKQMQTALSVLDERLAVVEIICSSQIAHRAGMTAVRARLVYYCVIENEKSKLEENLVAFMDSERRVVNLARELAGYPPVDQDAMSNARDTVDQWITGQDAAEQGPTI